MKASTHYAVSPRVLILFIMLLAAVTVIGITVVLAQNGVINEEGIPFVGGDQLVCYDSSGQPTGEIGDVLNGGEFRLLDINGQERMIILGEVVQDAIDNATPNVEIEVAIGNGSQGPAWLMLTLDSNGVVTYRFIGTTEPGKTNSFEFKACTPIRPSVAEEEEEEDEDDSICIVVLEKQSQLVLEDEFLPETVLCSDCDELGGHVEEGAIDGNNDNNDNNDTGDEFGFFCVVPILTPS